MSRAPFVLTDCPCPLRCWLPHCPAACSRPLSHLEPCWLRVFALLGML